MKNPQISIVIPVYNEEKNIKPFYKEIKKMLKKVKKHTEIIFVDDGSKDKTFNVLKQLKDIKIIQLRKNTGQSAALDAGIKHAKGNIIITMDGDGQNDPADIPAMLKKLNKGFDVVCGWRYKRKDPFLRKIISSGANFLRRLLVKDGVHDSGCTLRVYKKECFSDLNLYGELHRMIPALLKWRGFKITEIKTNHRPRKHGKSNYGYKRIVKGFLDMIYVWFWRKYSTRPLHLFGSIGLLFIFLGTAFISYLVYLKLSQGYALANKIWPLVSFVFILIGIQLLATGLLAANQVETTKNKHYIIKKIITT
jgi:glycosyltransferase involved in cell wall biosynthesis